MLREKNMSMYRLSQISGVPKTTVIDICSGKSNIEGCTAKTVMQLSLALGCTMEELMQIDNARYDSSTGLLKGERCYPAARWHCSMRASTSSTLSVCPL